MKRFLSTPRGAPTDTLQTAVRGVRLDTGGEVEVRGESHYQDALEAVCGGRTEDGADHRCLAAVVPEPTNAYDNNAVRVEIEGRLVGYLSRSAAQAYQPVAERLRASGRVGIAEAEIVGGWLRGKDRGHFGVCLYMAPPEALLRMIR